MNMNCRKCGKELSIGEYLDDVDVFIYNSVYGCDSGCEYVRFELSCECGDEFETGQFGYFEDDKERAEYLEEFMTEYFVRG